MRIEHWRPQSKYPAKQLDYRNLLATCQGNTGKEEDEHCDRRKKDAEISINPLNQTCETLIRYDGAGKIYSDDLIIDEELDKVLNLNLGILVKNRKTILEKIIQNFNNKYGDKSWSVESISREIERYSNLNKQGKYEPYCQYIVYFLRKKLTVAKNRQKSGE